MESIKFTNLVNVLTQFGEELVKAVKEQIVDYDAIATRGLYDSITLNPVTQDGDRIELTINLAKYEKFVEAGRKKGKMPPVGAIEDWIIAKHILPSSTRSGVPSYASLTPTLNDLDVNKQTYSSLAWAIATHIKNDGISPKPILKNSIDETLAEFRTRIAEAVSLDVGNAVGGVIASLWSNVKLDKVEGTWTDTEIRDTIVL